MNSSKKSAIYVLLIIVFSVFLYCYQAFKFDNSREIWTKSGLESKIKLSILNRALAGKRKIAKYSKIITIIDFTKPSTSKRLYLVDLWNQKLLYNTYVAHGQNTGEDMALYFSNTEESKKSSLGFYITKNTYYGKHGYSLRLQGIEKGINDNAEKRAIVIHGAAYVSKEFIDKNKRLGRSHGCPAIPQDISKKIIDIIKGGSTVYIHADIDEYMKKSKFR